MRKRWARLNRLEHNLPHLPPRRLEAARVLQITLRQTLNIPLDDPAPAPCPDWLTTPLPYANPETKRKRQPLTKPKTTRAILQQATSRQRKHVLRNDAAIRRKRKANTFLPHPVTTRPYISG